MSVAFELCECNRRYNEICILLKDKTEELNIIKKELVQLSIEENDINKKLKVISDKKEILNNFDELTLPYKYKYCKKFLKRLLIIELIYALICILIFLSGLYHYFNIQTLNWLITFILSFVFLDILNIYYNETSEFRELKNIKNFNNTFQEQRWLNDERKKIKEKTKKLNLKYDILYNEIENLKVQQSGLSDIINLISEKVVEISLTEEQCTEVIKRTREKKEGI